MLPIPLHSRFWPLWPQTGNCQLWPFWQLHIETLDSEPRQGPVWQPHLGPVWQLPIWVRMAPHIGTCHSGHSWQFSLGPRVAATCLFMVIHYFFIFYTKMRRLDGSRVVPGFIPAPLLLRWYGDVQLVSFFLFCHFNQNYLFWNNCFLDGSMWFLLFLAPLC